MFGPTDWQRLGMLAPVVEHYFQSCLSGSPDVGALVELRLQEAALGATVADRARLRWDLRSEPVEVSRPLRPARPRLHVVDPGVSG
jgi:hypothetical protein